MSLRAGFPRRSHGRMSGFRRSTNTADVTSWLSRGVGVGGTTNALDISNANTFITGLISAGLRSSIKRFNGYGGTNLSQCSVPLIADVGTPQDLFVAFVGADYSQATGLTGNGTSKYIRTGVIPSTMLTFNSNTFGVYMRDGLFNGSTGNFIGASDASNTLRMRVPDDDTTVVLEFTSALALTAIAGAYTTPWRLIAGTRGSSASQLLYQQGVNVTFNTGSSAGLALPTTEIYMFAWNNNGTPFGFHPNSEGCYVIADLLTAPQHLTLSNLIQAYNAGYSRAV